MLLTKFFISYLTLLQL